MAKAYRAETRILSSPQISCRFAPPNPKLRLLAVWRMVKRNR
jgi:hypothetical protein